MNQTDNILKALWKIANQNGRLSNAEICKILKAIEGIADYKEIINTLLYFSNAMTRNMKLRYAKLTKENNKSCI